MSSLFPLNSKDFLSLRNLFSQNLCYEKEVMGTCSRSIILQFQNILYSYFTPFFVGRIGFFNFGLFVCGLGDSFVLFCFVFGFQLGFFPSTVISVLKSLFQSLYKLYCHQEKILNLCCPLNRHNKGLNLNLVLVQWNFCLIRRKVSAGTSLRVIVTGIQLHPLCLEKILVIPICTHWLRISQTGHSLIGRWTLFFEVIYFSSHCFIKNCVLHIYPVSNSWLWRSAESAVPLSDEGELSVSHTLAMITGSWLLLAIVCLILYSNLVLFSIISYSIGSRKENSNIW